MKRGLISILVPTRGRPENVKRLINSVARTTLRKDAVEIIFYVDHDDESFPSQIPAAITSKVVKGERLWISLAWNFLFIHSAGEIIMYAGDDVVFETIGWDEEVRNAFKKFPDSLGLVYGNDGGWYSGRLAINGFVHRSWADLLGYLTYPGRVSAIDLWIHECALFIDRVIYLENVVFRHIHYRQGAASAEFDGTYKEAYEKSLRWDILESYRDLKRARRIDKIILARKIGHRIPFSIDYALAHFIINIHKIRGVNSTYQDRVLSLHNALVLKKLVGRLSSRRGGILPQTSNSPREIQET